MKILYKFAILEIPVYLDKLKTNLVKHPKYAGKLVNDPYWGVRKQVAKHSGYAGKLVNDSDWLVRMEVARHKEHAEKMINDPEKYVSDQAKQTLGIL